MFNLPPEVLRLIFPLLITGDQLECMSVCRQWYDNIYTPSLFRVIAIHLPDKLDQLIETVQRNSALGEKVERLTLRWIDSNYDGTIFFRLFPNLREFTVLSCDHEQVQIKPIEPRQNHPWCRNMETLIQIDSDYHVKTLLCSGTCKNLTKIEVNGFGTVRDLIKLLANAPTLKELEMFNYTVTLQDLELLHEKAPQLKSLTTFGVFLERSSIPLRIKPATSLKDFQCLYDDFDTFQNYLQLLEYICKKYTKLEVFKIEFSTFDSDENENQNDNVNDTMIHRNIQTLYTTAMTSLFKTWESQLKTLSVAVDFLRKPSPYFDWSILDKSGCHIQTLTLTGNISLSDFKSLSRTNQARCIQTLKIKWFLDTTNTQLISKWLSRFTALKKLTLVVYEDDDDPESISINDLMDLLKGIPLETLRLHNVRLLLANTNETQVYPLIKELHFLNVKFDKGADLCIAHMFPNLKRLALHNCLEDGDLFVLPNIHLFSLEVVNVVRGDSFAVLVITMDDRQQFVFNTTTVALDYIEIIDGSLENTLTLPCVSSTPLHKSKKVPKKTIQCNSLRKFAMANIE